MTESDSITSITQTILRERQARDRGWWERMRDCIRPDAAIRLSWFQGTGAEFVVQSEKMAERGQQAVHRLFPPVVTVSGARAVAEMAVAIEFRDVIGGVEADLSSYARLVYRLEKSEDAWRVVALDGIYERDAIVPVVPGDVPDLDRTLLAKFRAPYRFLGYYFADHGYSVSEDLYGDDRPAQVADLYRHTSAWLRP
ncbi:nuclear transport factor 2 family protein [Amycolatopsis rhabdoformis]|uniref:Nuclear transport factor 2 family protein n=1 Tax=Amycolatopsis rhabdoformis TaxID=1448059 RepID=A0ABZ1IM02_9PSEU|nr:nuclear transport factor 2 family protein [Amycolatopsis rhabdoformis]WSE34718.1 nuclear transport factor 2 family protein [Amycolatopsis rhabdoformis]